MSAQWSQDLQALANRTGLSMDTVIRKATFELFKSVALKSPVDTGRFRANWNVSIGAPDQTVTESTNGARALQQAQEALTLPVGGIVSMTNALPYARRLENGYSKQAPYGMVRYSVLEFRRFLLRAI